MDTNKKTIKERLEQLKVILNDPDFANRNSVERTKKWREYSDLKKRLEELEKDE